MWALSGLSVRVVTPEEGKFRFALRICLFRRPFLRQARTRPGTFMPEQMLSN